MRMSLFAALTVAGILAGCSPVDYCEGPSAKDLALFASQTFVKDRLRAPASAKFPTAYDARGVSVARIPPCQFSVHGYVDAQNAFGALLRTDYYATVEPNKEGRYSLISLTMDGD